MSIVFTFWLSRIMQLWTFLCNFLCGHPFSFLLGLSIPRSGIARSYGNSTFNFLRHCQRHILYCFFQFCVLEISCYWKQKKHCDKHPILIIQVQQLSAFHRSWFFSLSFSPLFPAKELEASLNNSFYVVNVAKMSFAPNHPFGSPTPTSLCGWNLGRMEESKTVSSGSMWGGKGIASEWNRTGDIICKMKMGSPLFKN